MSAHGSLDRKVAELASRQRALITTPALHSLGMSEGSIRHRERTGRLHRIYVGVYSVGCPPTSQEALLLAAVLACGPGASLSYLSGLALWEIWGRLDQRPIDVTATEYHRHRGTRLHRSRTLDHSQLTVHRGIPVTVPWRCLLDAADLLAFWDLRRAVNEARVRRLVSENDLGKAIDLSRGRRGSRKLRAIIAREPGLTRSGLEDLFADAVRQHGLSTPEFNVRVAGHEVDAVWLRERVVVELDGRAFHDTPDAFERDRERDADLAAAGFVTVRITHRRLSSDPKREMERLRTILVARNPSLLDGYRAHLA